MFCYSFIYIYNSYRYKYTNNIIHVDNIDTKYKYKVIDNEFE